MLHKLKEHRLFGAILLVAGCCIGAGMLGLPLVTAASGLFPSFLLFIFSWLFMLTTGLLLLEVNLAVGSGYNLMTLAEVTLGKWAKWMVAGLFSFLFYCLLVAYLAGGGSIIAEFLANWVHIDISPTTGSLAMVLLFGITLFMGAYTADLFNRLLMAGLAISYLGLLVLGLPEICIENCRYIAWNYALPALPAMIISFGFHNLVPTLTEYLDADVKNLRKCLIIGSAIPLIVYLLWDLVILGLIPSDATLNGLEGADMVTTLLKKSIGSSLVVDFLHAFAFFALVTSFLAVALSFVDFVKDGFHLKRGPFSQLLAVSTVLLPPMLFAYFYPTVFLTALNYAGAFGAVVLFGIIPVLMAWKKRYREKLNHLELVPGGKALLLVVLFVAAGIFLMQLKIELI